MVEALRLDRTVALKDLLSETTRFPRLARLIYDACVMSPIFEPITARLDAVAQEYDRTGTYLTEHNGEMVDFTDPDLSDFLNAQNRLPVAIPEHWPPTAPTPYMRRFGRRKRTAEHRGYASVLRRVRQLDEAEEAVLHGEQRHAGPDHGSLQKVVRDVSRILGARLWAEDLANRPDADADDPLIQYTLHALFPSFTQHLERHLKHAVDRHPNQGNSIATLLALLTPDLIIDPDAPANDRRPPEEPEKVDPKTVRTWATTHGYNPPARGRLSHHVVAAYRQAQ